MHPVEAQKASLRRALRRLRMSMQADEAASKSRAIAALLWRTPEFSRAAVVLSYLSSKENEVDTVGIIERVHAEGRQVFLPVTLPDRSLSWHRYQPGDPLRTVALGIQEPMGGRIVSPAEATRGVCLVPGLGFTEQGDRLGLGMGFFDRFLSESGVYGIGLAYECQLQKVLPVETHDMSLPLIVTESRVIHCTPQAAT